MFIFAVALALSALVQTYGMVALDKPIATGPYKPVGMSGNIHSNVRYHGTGRRPYDDSIKLLPKPVYGKKPPVIIKKTYNDPPFVPELLPKPSRFKQVTETPTIVFDEITDRTDRYQSYFVDTQSDDYQKWLEEIEDIESQNVSSMKKRRNKSRNLPKSHHYSHQSASKKVPELKLDFDDYEDMTDSLWTRKETDPPAFNGYKKKNNTSNIKTPILQPKPVRVTQSEKNQAKANKINNGNGKKVDIQLPKLLPKPVPISNYAKPEDSLEDYTDSWLRPRKKSIDKSVPALLPKPIRPIMESKFALPEDNYADLTDYWWRNNAQLPRHYRPWNSETNNIPLLLPKPVRKMQNN